MIVAERGESGGVDIGWGDGALQRDGADGVRGSDYLAALNSSSSQNDAVTAGPVIAAAVLVDLGRAAEFAHPDDEG